VGGPLGELILVHGYRTTEQHLVDTYSHYAEALGRDCIGYSWPGGDTLLDFPLAVRRADSAGWRFRDLLSIRKAVQHASERPVDDVIVSHSLGARVVLRALNDPDQEVSKIILMGAAVDYDCLSARGAFASVAGNCREIHLICSRNDPVLRDVFPFGDIGGDKQALGCYGPKPNTQWSPNITVHDLSPYIHDHGDYLVRPECIALVKSLIG
jgi:pimeloyl-ACP methyl ester carboxylesterase